MAKHLAKFVAVLTPKRRWAQFSLASMFVVVAALCVAIGYYATTRDLHQAKKELRTLRDETGRLSVEDKSKVHAIAVVVDEPNTWRWRLFIPKGHRYSWYIACDDIPADGVPNDGIAGVSNEPYWENDNEVLVTAKLRPAGEDQWVLSVTSKIGDSKPQMYGTELKVPADELRWMTEISSVDVRGIGHRGTEVYDPSGPIILLQRRACERQPDGTYQPSAKPMPGFVIWLKEL